MAFIEVALSLSELSGITHYMKELMPWVSSIRIGRIVLNSSIMTFLSLLCGLMSLNPGESISFISPVVPILTH